MYERDRVPKSLVKKYANEITFLVTTDECIIEAIEPITLWIEPLGYEVDEKILRGSLKCC